MTLMKIDQSLFPRLVNTWEDFLTQDIADVGSCRSCNTPAVNIVETPHNFMLHLAVPGMRRDDLKVNVDNGILTISAETKEEHTIKERDSKVTRKEFSYHHFKRSFTLPEAVVTDKVEATYENGILAITIPKQEEAKVLPTKHITVK